MAFGNVYAIATATVSMVVGIGAVTDANAFSTADAASPPAQSAEEEVHPIGVPAVRSAVALEPYAGNADDGIIGNGDLCGPSYFDNGIITVDLADFGTVDPGATLTIGSGGTLSCANLLDEVRITRTGGVGGHQNLIIAEQTFTQSTSGGANRLSTVVFPEGLETLTIGEGAFVQLTLNGAGNRLSTVVFPEGLETLTIGVKAFVQMALNGGSTALSDVAFPESLQTLDIGELAFAQDGFATLSRVTFPASLESLRIGPEAFNQLTNYGGSNALASVVFPEAAESLSIGDRAFSLSDAPGDLMLFFRFDGDGVPSDVVLGADITTGSQGPDGSKWVWLGSNGVSTSDVDTGWGTDESYFLNGTLTASFEPNGGAVAQEELYVFPAIEEEPQVAPLGRILELDPAGFRSESGQFLLPMPAVDPDDHWDGLAALQGWCPGQWDNGNCSESQIQPGNVTVLEPEDSTHAFAAGWQAVPAAPTLEPSAGCGIPPAVTVPGDVEGLFSYEQEQSPGLVTLTTIPAGPYVSVPPTVWSFDVSLPTYTVSFALNGGTGTFEDLIVQGEGCSVTLPPTAPTKNGHQFTAWQPTIQGQKAGEPLSPKALYTVTADTVMDAQWKQAAPPRPVPPEDSTKPGTDTKKDTTKTVTKKTVPSELATTGSSTLLLTITGLALLTAGAITLRHQKRNRG